MVQDHRVGPQAALDGRVCGETGESDARPSTVGFNETMGSQSVARGPNWAQNTVGGSRKEMNKDVIALTIYFWMNSKDSFRQTKRVSTIKIAHWVANRHFFALFGLSKHLGC